MYFENWRGLIKLSLPWVALKTKWENEPRGAHTAKAAGELSSPACRMDVVSSVHGETGDGVTTKGIGRSQMLLF